MSESLRIGVCIPCYSRHIPYLRQCLESIQAQTRKPDIVSISISSMNDSIPIDFASYVFPIRLKVSSEKQCAGKNRNIAAELIHDKVDILSFFDADDIMHPKRLELLEKQFMKHSLDSCVHYFMRGTNSDRETINTIIWPETTETIHLSGPEFKVGRDSVCGRVWYIGKPNKNELGQCGQITVKSTVWNTLKYKEKMIGEDSEFVWQVYTSGAKHGFIPDVLSMYIQNDKVHIDNLHFYSNSFKN